MKKPDTVVGLKGAKQLSIMNVGKFWFRLLQCKNPARWPGLDMKKAQSLKNGPLWGNPNVGVITSQAVA